jgi:hypothetical protein
MSETYVNQPPEDPEAFKRWIEVGKLRLEHDKAELERELEREKLKLARAPLTRFGPLFVPIIVALLTAAAVALLVVTIQNSVAKINARADKIVTTLKDAEATQSRVANDLAALTAELDKSIQVTNALTVASQTQAGEIRDALSQLRNPQNRSRGVPDALGEEKHNLQIIAGSLVNMFGDSDLSQWHIRPTGQNVNVLLPPLVGASIGSRVSIKADVNKYLQPIEILQENSAGNWVPFSSCAVNNEATCDLVGYTGWLQITIHTTSDDPIEIDLLRISPG